MSTSDQPSEEELRAAYEAEIKKIRVEQIVLEQVVSLVNLGMRRTGLSPGTEDERDAGQVRTAIEAVRALLPLIEQSAPPQASAIRDALSQLQLAYLRLDGGGEAGPAPAGPAAGRAGTDTQDTQDTTSAQPGPTGSAGEPDPNPSAPPPEPDPATPGEPGPAQRSGRLWVPGQ
jgi:hypothetical protein